MEFKVGNSIVNSYKRLSYTPWYAFAEFVDNSTQAYFNKKEELDKVYQKESTSLTVKIDYDLTLDRIIISDNSYGMNKEVLQRALIVGEPPENNSWRSKYGLGMKTAAFWFGDEWKIRTTQLNDPVVHEVIVNVDDINKSDIKTSTRLHHIEEKIDPSEHFTIIEIWNLNRELRGRTLWKIRDYLTSMYRVDFRTYGLKLFWQNSLLGWDELDKKLYKTLDGKPYKQKFEFEISNGKTVKGWVGVLGPGHAGRKNAGFSIIKADRVIEGWPRSFKPDSVFGDLDDGRNDLVNQRVVGELYLDDFEVSHTKDSIVWLDNEYQEVDDKLGDVCKEAIYIANTARYKKDSIQEEAPIKLQAITTFESELKSSELRDYLTNVQPPEEEILEIALKNFSEKSTQGRDPDLQIEIGSGTGKVEVTVYFIENSEFDPYVLIETSPEEDSVIVIINAAHPHYQEIDSSETLLHFIRHCVYDGVSEWKAIKMMGSIQPYTIKNLKDGLLRIPFHIKQNQFTHS